MKEVRSVINNIETVERSGTLTAAGVIKEILDLAPGSVYRLRKCGHNGGEAFTYLRVITRPEYDAWEP